MGNSLQKMDSILQKIAIIPHKMGNSLQKMAISLQKMGNSLQKMTISVQKMGIVLQKMDNSNVLGDKEYNGDNEGENVGPKAYL
jgi:hypothetical protein